MEKENDGRYCNRVLVNPILNMFAGEPDSKLFFDFLAEGERDEKYDGEMKKLIEDAVEMYSHHNPAALNKVHD